MTPCLKTWGSLANLEGQNFFYVKYLFLCLHMPTYYRYLKNVPYRKIMVVSKFGACFLSIGLRLTAFNCYFFCFMGIMQLCCVACS